MEEIPPKAKQPSTWIQVKLQDWKRENTASIWLSTCLAGKKNLDWMVGVGKGMKMAAQEKGGESRHVLSLLDLHRWHAGENKCYKDFDNVLIMQPHCQHAICIIPSHRDAPKLPEDIWVPKHGHSSFISKQNMNATLQWKKKCHHNSRWAWMTEMKDGNLHSYLALDFRF